MLPDWPQISLLSLAGSASREDYIANVALPAGFGFTRLRVDFKYDFMGRRVEKTVFDLEANTARPTRRYLYEGWNLLAELDGTGANLQRSYTWGLDLTGSLGRSGGVGAMLQMHDHTSSKTYWPTYDGNGNVVTLVNAGTGALAAVYEYDPFGNYLRAEVRDATVADNPWRFSTKYTDPETGLVYYGYRYYSPALGRFINRDPIGERGGINLYGFAGNDAINGWDYLGLFRGIWQQLITEENEDSGGGGGKKDDEDVQQADPFEVFGDRIYGLSPEKDALDRAQLGSSTGAGIIIELRFIDPNDVVAPNNPEREKLKKECDQLKAAADAAFAASKTLEDRYNRQDKFVSAVRANFADSYRKEGGEMVKDFLLQGVQTALALLSGPLGPAVSQTWDAVQNASEGDGGAVASMINTAAAGYFLTNAVRPASSRSPTFPTVSRVNAGGSMLAATVGITVFKHMGAPAISEIRQGNILKAYNNELAGLMNQAGSSMMQGLAAQKAWVAKGCDRL